MGELALLYGLRTIEENHTYSFSLGHHTTAISIRQRITIISVFPSKPILNGLKVNENGLEFTG